MTAPAISGEGSERARVPVDGHPDDASRTASARRVKSSVGGRWQPSIWLT